MISIQHVRSKIGLSIMESGIIVFYVKTLKYLTLDPVYNKPVLV